jgi:predicted ATP-binding protein involved in virulence
MVELSQEEALKIANDIKTWLTEDKSTQIYIGKYITTRGIKRDSLSAASKKYPDVKEIMSECSELQKFKIIDFATRSQIDRKFAEFILINYYGFKSSTGSDKSNTKKHTSKTNDEISDTDLDGKLKDFEEKLNAGEPATETPAN